MIDDLFHVLETIRVQRRRLERILSAVKRREREALQEIKKSQLFGTTYYADDSFVAPELFDLLAEIGEENHLQEVPVLYIHATDRAKTPIVALSLEKFELLVQAVRVQS